MLWCFAACADGAPVVPITAQLKYSSNRVIAALTCACAALLHADGAPVVPISAQLKYNVDMFQLTLTSLC
jgi:translation initiation factor 2 gamma subunit (eIF-2gamma)